MTVDTAQYVATLDATLPAAGEPLYDGDDQIRALKKAMQQSFPAVSGAVTTSHTEFNYVTGVTSAIQTQLNAKAPAASPTFTGTPVAPTPTTVDNSTALATTAFVQAVVAAMGATPTSMLLSVSGASSISAVVGQHIVCTYAGTVTVTLPASPSAGDTVWITPGNGRTDTVVARNGLLIMGLAEDLTIDNTNMTVELRYASVGLGWRLV